MKDCFQSDIKRHLVESSVSETWYFRVALNSPLLLPEAFRFELLDRSGNKYAGKIILILLSNFTLLMCFTFNVVGRSCISHL